MTKLKEDAYILRTNNGDTWQVEDDHTLKEYRDNFGVAYDDGELWDFSEEDVKSGAIEAQPNMVYWKIKVNGDEPRYFETTIFDEWDIHECKEELGESEEKLDEGTSNFRTPDYFPLLVFYTYDEFYYNMEHDSDYPDIDNFENEDGEVDYDAYDDARDTFEQDYWDKNEICVLDEDEQERLDNKLWEFNEETKRIADELDVDEDGYQSYGPNINLADVELKIEPGYYSGAYIDIDNEKSLDYCDDKVKEEQIKRINDFLEALRKEFGLTKLGVAWGPASNGETGYKILNDSLKEENSLDISKFSDTLDKVDKELDSLDEVFGIDDIILTLGGSIASILIDSITGGVIWDSIKGVGKFLKDKISKLFSKFKKKVKPEDVDKLEDEVKDKINDSSSLDGEQKREALGLFDKLLDNSLQLQSESLEEAKEDKGYYEIEFWVDEEARDQGLGDIAIETFDNLEDAKEYADKLFGEVASVEVLDANGNVVYGRYPEDESLKEDKVNEAPENPSTHLGYKENGEEVIKQVGHAYLLKKGNRYIVRYAPGYYVNDIKASSDEEAINKFLGLDESIQKLAERKSKKKLKFRYTGDPAKDAAFFNHCQGTDVGDVGVEASSVSLGEEEVKESLDDYYVVSDGKDPRHSYVFSENGRDLALDMLKDYKGNGYWEVLHYVKGNPIMIYNTRDGAIEEK